MYRLAPVFAYAALAVGLTWPAALHPLAATPGAERTDLHESLWTLWFVRLKLLAGQLPVDATGLLNHPRGGSLWPADPLNALLSLPLQPWAGVAGAWTLLVLLHLTWAGVAAHRFGAEVAGDERAGWLAGVGVAGSAFLMAQVHNGASEGVALAPMVLALRALWQLRRAPSARGALVAGAWWGLATVGSWYYGAALGFAWAIGLAERLLLADPGVTARTGSFLVGVRGCGRTARFAAARLPGQWSSAGRKQIRQFFRRATARRQNWLRETRPLLPWLAALGLCGALAGPVAALAHDASTRADNLVGIKSDHELATLRRSTGPADPRGFLTPGHFRSPDFVHLSRYAEQHVHCTYLGWVLLGAAAYGLRRGAGTGAPSEGSGGRAGGALPGADGHRPRRSPLSDRAFFALVLAAAVIAAMGPVLVADGGAVILPGRRGVPLPWFLVEGLPGLSGLSLLYRFTGLGVVALALLAARGVPARLAPWLAVAALLELRLVSPAADLPAHSDTRLSPVFARLAEAPEGAVMSWPVVGGRAVLYEQTAHHKPLAATLNFPNNPASKRVWQAAIDGGRLPPAALVERVGRVAKKEGVRWLVVHDDPEAEPDMHLAAVRALEAALPVWAEGDGVRILQLW